MKESYFQRFSLLLIIIALISSCKSTHFVTRKYTSGIYRESKQTVHKPNSINTEKQVYSANKVGSKVRDFIETELEPEISLKEKNTARIKDNIKRNFNINFNLKKSIQEIKKESSKLKQSHVHDKKIKSNNTIDNKPEKNALIGFIFAMAAILFILAAILLLYSNPYSLTLCAVLFLLGLILGVVGLIFGTIAKKNHKRNGGSSIDLTFSLIATIIGVLCMIALIASIIILLVALILILLIFI